VDGNVTNLIVTFVLANLGTQEIKGFAITLGYRRGGDAVQRVGRQSRLVLALLIDVVKVKKMSMLPTAIPPLERALEPDRLDEGCGTCSCGLVRWAWARHRDGRSSRARRCSTPSSAAGRR
jgi:hypothetical protein